VTSCIVDSAVIYIMVVKFRNTICPPPPQLSLHRRAALSSNSNGTQYVYSRKNPKAVYIVRCLWCLCVNRPAEITYMINPIPASMHTYCMSIWLVYIHQHSSVVLSKCFCLYRYTVRPLPKYVYMHLFYKSQRLAKKKTKKSSNNLLTGSHILSYQCMNTYINLDFLQLIFSKK
jgi:hypothetical protein